MSLLAGAALAACSSSGNTTAGSGNTQPVRGTTPPTTSSASTPVSGLGGSACTKLKALEDLDYAFGKPWIAIESLEASSKRQTIADIQQFQASAPSELTSAVPALITFWQHFESDANAVDEAGYNAVGQPFVDYVNAHCS
jgi:hypothetical protein